MSHRPLLLPASRLPRPRARCRHCGFFRYVPPAAASGVTWIAAGTRRMRRTCARRSPGRRGDRDPAARRASGVSLCSSGMPFARGPWKRTTATKSRSSSPRSNAACTSSWSSNTSAGASITMRSSGTADTLITARPRLPSSTRRPPSARNGSSAARSTPVAALLRHRSRQTQPSVVEHGSCAIAAMPVPKMVLTSPCSRPASSSCAIRNAMPPAAWKWFTSALPFG